VSVRADIVVGVPTRAERSTVAAVAEACSAGLRERFGGCDALLVNADSDSRDGTREAFLSARTSHRRLSVNTGGPGKGLGVRRIMEIAQEAGAERIAIVDGDLLNPNPTWMHRLLSPLDRYEYVIPHYRRQKYDGTCTNHVCYPLLYALTGKQIRQPIGGEFAFSRRYLEHALGQPWTAAAHGFGIDIFMTTTALVGDFRVCQARLGAKTHAVRSHYAELAPQVIDSFFEAIDRNREAFVGPSPRGDVPLVGDPDDETPAARQPLDAVVPAKREYEHCVETLRRHLDGETADGVAAAYAAPTILLDQRTWIRALLELLAAYSSSGRDRSLVRAAAALSLGRMVTFWREVRDLSEEEAEDRVREEAAEMAANRGLLLERWAALQVT
jgi:glucosylglycerate synthase